MGIRIDGKALAEKMQEDMKQEVKELKTKGITPGLVVLLVGENPASQTYVKNKELAATRLGLHSEVSRYDASITEEDLLAEIARYNQDEAFHGILVQLPLLIISILKKSCWPLTLQKMSMVFTR